ncbi:fungal-specific transcription factor domain-containing protein [Aspergillus californicus]
MHRIRQACSTCRRRKTKCSGERPICFHCRRNRHACVYEPYSVTALPPVSHNVRSSSGQSELLQRIDLIESRLAELSNHNTQRTPSSDTPAHETSSHPFINPPQHIQRSLIDTYFVHVHNHPYSHFHETSFRQSFDSSSLPRSLLLAVLASAVRFSKHEFYRGRTLEASEVYSRGAWLSVLTDDLTSEDTMSLHVVQAVNILAVVEHTAGRINSGWLKLGLGARISQAMGLMREPDPWLPFAEQEERRRVFWSVYLLDKLISCGRSRPIVILDQDCQLRLPCIEDSFRKGEAKPTHTLHQLLDWNTQMTESPSPFALVVLLASILGRCTRYVYRTRDSDDIPPWDTRSEYAAINSSLLLFESYVNMGPIHRSDTAVGEILDHQTYAYSLFHLCHCLLNHPFLLHIRLQPLGTKVPHSFAARALQAGVDHATSLVDTLISATDTGTRIESSSYSFCVTVAASILSITAHAQDHSLAPRSSDILLQFQRGLEVLDRLAKLWMHAMNMSLRLREFHTRSQSLVGLLDPARLGSSLDPASEEMLWSMLDYATLALNFQERPQTPTLSIPTLPSPTSWPFETGLDTTASVDVHEAPSMIFNASAPSVRLDELEYLLNCNSPRRGYL